MPDAPVPDAPADALVAWATAGGLRMHSSLVVTSGAMRGRALLATEPIPKGTELLRVPYDLLLTSKDTPRDFGDLGQTNRLAVALLMERRQPARWAHPLAMLPESFDTPLYHTPGQLAWLQGSPLVAWSHGREQAMLRSLGSIQDRWTTSAAVQSTGAVAEGDAGALGIDELRWALSVAWSRSFMVRLQVGAPKTASLVPMGDLINHAEDVLANTASRSEPEGSAFVFYADRPIARGEECTTSYGHVGEPSNAVLMLDYGFCLPYSSHDEVSVDLSPPADADPMQAAWLQRLGLTDHAARTSLTLFDRRSGAPQTSLSPEVLVTLRVRALEPNLLRSASPQQLMQPLQPAAAEAHALGLLAEALRSRLTEYARPFAADERELRALIALAGGMAGAAGSAGAAGAVGAADGDAGDGAVVAARRQCALSLVVGERRVLHHWLGLVIDLEEQLRPPNPLSPSPSPSPSPSRSPSLSPTASPSSPVLHSYLSDGTPWDPLVNNTDSGIGAEVHLRDAPTRCTLEVRTIAPEHVRTGLFVAAGTCAFEPGDLVGCYSGQTLDAAAWQAKRLAAPRATEHVYWANSTHVIDPTSESGHMHDTVPPYRHEMAVVNEGSLPQGLPNLYPLDYEHGRCRDRYDALGVAYYAASQIVAGDELLVCYGADFGRVSQYTSMCADTALLARWSALQRLMLRRRLH